MALRAKPNVPVFQSDHPDNAFDYDHDDHAETGDDGDDKLVLVTFSQSFGIFQSKDPFDGVFRVGVAVFLWSISLITKLL